MTAWTPQCTVDPSQQHACCIPCTPCMLHTLHPMHAAYPTPHACMLHTLHPMHTAYPAPHACCIPCTPCMLHALCPVQCLMLCIPLKCGAAYPVRIRVAPSSCPAPHPLIPLYHGTPSRVPSHRLLSQARVEAKVPDRHSPGAALWPPGSLAGALWPRACYAPLYHMLLAECLQAWLPVVAGVAPCCVPWAMLCALDMPCALRSSWPCHAPSMPLPPCTITGSPMTAHMMAHIMTREGGTVS